MNATGDTVLVVPGLRGSGPAHWQTWFEHEVPGAIRVEQAEWDHPELVVWAASLERAIEAARGPLWLVAHSFGCLVTAAVLPRHRERIAGVMLVAPADPDKFGLSAQLLLEPFEVPCVLVASINDPWMRFLRAAWLAERWECRLINLGAVGHINTDAGFGPWPQGRLIFERLRGSHDGGPNGTIEAARLPGPGRAARPYSIDGYRKDADSYFWK